MCNQISNCWEPKDWLILLIGLLFTAIWPFILYILKPKLEIQSVEIKDMQGKCLAVTVVNIGNSDAVNLHMEICAKKGAYTYHLDIDNDDFIILPKKTNKTAEGEYERTFKSYDIASFTRRYYKDTFDNFIKLIQKDESEFILRIRIHANHSFSGFGRAFEKKFKYINGFQPIE